MKIRKEDIHKIEDYLWEIMEDRSLVQLVNVASLPGIQGASLVMPDVHEGYGFPIGGVAATLYPHGAISPGGIGYDINCGVRLLTSDQKIAEIKEKLDPLSKELYAQIPSGMGKGGQIKLSRQEMDKVLLMGAEWAVEKGYGVKEDLAFMESKGRLENADATLVSDMAKKRGTDQLGTIGSGNHFVEVDYIEEIYDESIAEAYGLYKGQLVVLIHTGSRGLGHQVATDYIRQIMNAMPYYNIEVPDRELACVPFNSKEGQSYFKAMCAAANYAWCNREIISWEVRTAWKLMYDVAHNIAKVETHLIDGVQTDVIVHRKGATRAFGPGFEELPASYKVAGQPVIIPGSMGTCSYVLSGTARSKELTFGSCCHGAGRRLSRTAAKKQVNAPVLKEKLKEKGIFVEAGSFKGISFCCPYRHLPITLWLPRRALVQSFRRTGLRHENY